MNIIICNFNHYLTDSTSINTVVNHYLTDSTSINTVMRSSNKMTRHFLHAAIKEP